MADYGNVKISKLSFKGESQKGKKRKHKSKKHEKEKVVVDKDSISHGNWWKVTKIEDMCGPVAIEFGDQTYVKALDNGLFTLGAPHNEFEGPSPEEILTAVAITERKVAFKSGYGKYLRVEKNGNITGRSDAIGPLEQWEPVFQDGKMAIQSNTESFLSVDDDDNVVAKSRTAGEAQFLQIRCQTVRQDTKRKEVPDEEQGTLEQVEINYVKKFQKFQDKKLKISQDGKQALEKAKTEGTFYETMLDRRSKMKADRYCK
ncbi:PREDICTED: protein FRG1 homolog [Nicrophorus vespilloides]|uniref:Protein FRG1 homolog n=1 Tax=Nicrophorus vespilloides TaxID=110193 RepID=A0ABM1NFS4_NICVS|nr:PREDICTED: protein FRG1 homolog [Nicrophorus vespilloides]